MEAGYSPKTEERLPRLKWICNLKFGFFGCITAGTRDALERITHDPRHRHTDHRPQPDHKPQTRVFLSITETRRQVLAIAMRLHTRVASL
jgi:hypothetical protein